MTKTKFRITCIHERKPYGQYCAIKADVQGGIHIAAYNRGGTEMVRQSLFLVTELQKVPQALLRSLK